MEGGGRSDPAAWGELSRAALPTLQRSRHEAGARGAPLAPELIYGECRASIRLQCNGKVNIYDAVMLMTKETKQPNKLFQSSHSDITSCNRTSAAAEMGSSWIYQEVG